MEDVIYGLFLQIQIVILVNNVASVRSVLQDLTQNFMGKLN